MALEINLLPRDKGGNIRLSKEGQNMAAGLNAEVRVYRTIDGELVRENDPRGAFLAYSVGDEVAGQEADAYQALLDGARSGHEVPGLMHDKLATTAADAARVVANAPESPAAEVAQDALKKAAEIVDADQIPAPVVHAEPPSELLRRAAQGDDRPVADGPLYRTGDGRLVREGDTDAVTLAYGKGDRVEKGDQDAYGQLPPAEDKAPRRAKAAAKPADKQAEKPADK